MGQDEEEFVLASRCTDAKGERAEESEASLQLILLCRMLHWVVFPRFGGVRWCLGDRRLSPQVAVVLCRAPRAASLHLA